MKRLLLAAACAALVFGAIGCNKTDNATTDNAVTTPSTDNAAPPVGAPAGGKTGG